MKPSPAEKLITNRMQPGVFCLDGFLGSDRRSLGEIIDTDRSAAESLGATDAQIAGKMQAVVQEAMAACGSLIRFDEHLTAEFKEAMGRIPCPFGDGVFPKGEVEMTDLRSNRKYYFTPLSVHMIGVHGFYQGKGCRYRIGPAEICRLFGLAGNTEL